MKERRKKKEIVIGVKPEFFSVHASYIHERDAETNLTPLGKAFLAIGISCIRCPKMTKQQYASSIFLIFYRPNYPCLTPNNNKKTSCAMTKTPSYPRLKRINLIGKQVFLPCL